MDDALFVWPGPSLGSADSWGQDWMQPMGSADYVVQKRHIVVQLALW